MCSSIIRRMRATLDRLYAILSTMSALHRIGIFGILGIPRVMRGLPSWETTPRVEQMRLVSSDSYRCIAIVWGGKMDAPFQQGRIVYQLLAVHHSSTLHWIIGVVLEYLLYPQVVELAQTSSPSPRSRYLRHSRFLNSCPTRIR